MYPPSHPWYYRDHPPVPVTQIPPGDATISDDLPPTRRAQVAELAAARAALARDIARYQDLADRGEAALAPPDRLFGGLPSALALVYSHIAYNRGLILALEAVLGPEQLTLF